MRKLIALTAIAASLLAVVPGQANPTAGTIDFLSFSQYDPTTKIYFYFYAQTERTLTNPLPAYSGCGYMFDYDNYQYLDMCGFKLDFTPGGLTGTVSGTLVSGNVFVGQVNIDLLGSVVNAPNSHAAFVGVLPSSRKVEAFGVMCRSYVANGSVSTTIGSMQISDMYVPACSSAGGSVTATT